MFVIPINDIANQTLSAQIAGQNCSIDIYQKSNGLFLDLYVSNSLIIGGVLCENLNFIVRDDYLGFIGDILFNDTQGNSDPSTPGLGTRYQLCYLAPDEVTEFTDVFYSTTH